MRRVLWVAFAKVQGRDWCESNSTSTTPPPLTFRQNPNLAVNKLNAGWNAVVDVPERWWWTLSGNFSLLLRGLAIQLMQLMLSYMFLWIVAVFKVKCETDVGKGLGQAGAPNSLLFFMFSLLIKKCSQHHQSNRNWKSQMKTPLLAPRELPFQGRLSPWRQTNDF